VVCLRLGVAMNDRYSNLIGLISEAEGYLEDIHLAHCDGDYRKMLRTSLALASVVDNIYSISSILRHSERSASTAARSALDKP